MNRLSNKGHVRRAASSRIGRTVATAATAAALIGLSLSSVAGAASATRLATRTAVAPMYANASQATVGLTPVVSTPRPTFGYSAPGGHPVIVVPPTWQGSSLVMPVLSIKPGYVKVRLPQRPNGLTTWLKTKNLYISATPYRIVIVLHSTHLLLYRFGKVVLNAPIGIGTARYPTPTGNFFITFYAAPPSSGYGPFVMVTSAHSNTITDWEGTGDAMVAIHGALGADALIGTTGARVSHGCIRMHVSQLRHLGVVPVGTPVTIAP